METAMATKKIIVEVEDDKILSRILEELGRLGVKARVEPDPAQIRKRIMNRWRKLGRRAKPGELKGASLEEEFE